MNVTSTMRELSIDKDSFRVLGLLPLVYVAWADGAMQRAERATIRKIAKDKGWLAGDGERILDGWLEAAPTQEYARTGFALLQELAHQKRGVGAALTTESLGELLVLCRDVAEAAGGAWGLGEPISSEESEALGEVAEAFGVASADAWRAIVAEAEAAMDNEAPGPKGNFLLGDAPALLADAPAFLLRCARQYGPVTGLRVPGIKVFLIWQPEHIQYVVTDNGRNYIRGRNFDAFRPLIRESILTTSGDEWKRFRRLAQPAFHQRAVAGMAEAMGRYANEMCDSWQERADAGEELDVAAELTALTLRIIGQALFSLDLQGEANHEFSEAVAVGIEATAYQMSPLRVPSFIPTPQNLRFKRAVAYFDETIKGFIEERRTSGELGDDLLGMLLAARDEETGEGLSDEHLRNEMLTYLVAGHETTATTLTWLFYLLSKNPVPAQRMDAELADVLGGRAPSAEELGALDYTTMVINEAMRLYPAAFLTSREAVAEDHIGGYTVPAGSWVMISPYITHRAPTLWDNPEGFDPERFSPERSGDRHPCAFIPFFAGPHKCIGQALSMLEMKIVAAVVRQRFRLDLVPGCEPEVDAKVTLRAKQLLMTAHRWD